MKLRPVWEKKFIETNPSSSPEIPGPLTPPPSPGISNPFRGGYGYFLELLIHYFS